MMNELYRMIEERIRESGYPGKIDGQDFYNDISAEADEKENGTYLFLIKKDDLVSYHGCMQIMDEEFDLKYVEIHVGEQVYKVDFQ